MKTLTELNNELEQLNQQITKANKIKNRASQKMVGQHSRVLGRLIGKRRELKAEIEKLTK